MERNPDLELIQAPSYDADEITRQARAIADQAFKRYDIDGNGTIDKEELFDMCLTVGQVAFIFAFSLTTLTLTLAPGCFHVTIHHAARDRPKSSAVMRITLRTVGGARRRAHRGEARVS